MREEGRRKGGSLQALREHSPGWPGSQAFLQKGPQQMEHSTHIPGKGGGGVGESRAEERERGALGWKEKGCRESENREDGEG